MEKQIRILFIAEDAFQIDKVVLAFQKANYHVKHEAACSEYALNEALNNKNWDLILFGYIEECGLKRNVMNILRKHSKRCVLFAFYEDLSAEEAFRLGRSECVNCLSINEVENLPEIYEAENDCIKKVNTSGIHFSIPDSVLNHIGDGVISCNRNGDIIFINEEAQSITGWRREEVDDRKISDIFKLVHSKTNDNLPDIFGVVMKTGIRSGLANETMLLTRDGRKCYLSANVSPIKDALEEVAGAVGVFRDITRLKKIEEELRKERDNIKTFFQFAPVGIIILNEKREIMDYNQSLLNLISQPEKLLFGLRLGEGIGCINSIPHGCGNSLACNSCKMRMAIADVINTGNSFSNLFMEYDLIHGDITARHYLKVSAVPLMLSDGVNAIIAIEDISEIKRNELALKESENKFKNLFNNVTDAIFVIRIKYNEKSKPKLSIIEVNDTACKLLEYSRQELFSMHPRRLMPFEDRTIEKKFLNDVRLNLDTSFQTKLLSKKGRKIEAEVFAHNVMLGGETVLMAIVRDITEQIKAQRHLQSAMEAAKAAYKAKSEFLANMSHEIRTPLNGIIGMVDLCLLSKLSSDQRDNMMTAKSCASSLLNIINDILDFSKLEAGKMVIEHIPFNMKEILEKIEKVHYFKANDKGLNLVFDIPEDLPESLYGDPNRLEQVINNLLSNAVKFTEHGWVRLSVSLMISDARTADIRFSIEDSGIGIAKEDLSKLFQSFTQVDGSHTRKYGGTGLGLVISKHLIDSMGGCLSVSSIKGQGSSFVFELGFEIVQTKDLLNEKENPLELKKARNKAHLLLVEDDKINQMVVGRMLKMLGYSYEVACNGLEALQLISKSSFHMCLMDIQMPEMDGIKATEEIRKMEKKSGKHLPIIALTAYALAGDKERFIQAGMDDYLSKPLGINDLGEKLEQIMERYNLSADEAYTAPQENEFSSYEIEEENKNFVKNIENSLKNLKIAIDKGDIPSIELYSSDIHSNASLIGDELLKIAAFRIMLLSRKGRISECREACKKLEDQWQEFLMKDKQ